VRRLDAAVKIDHLAESDSRDQSRCRSDRDPAARVRVPADHCAGGLGKGEDARGAVERLEAARDLALLRREPFGRHGAVGLHADFRAETHNPAIELFEAGAATGATVEVRVFAAGRPEARELTVVQVTPAKALKK
jgi:hypothetical protein